MQICKPYLSYCARNQEVSLYYMCHFDFVMCPQAWKMPISGDVNLWDVFFERPVLQRFSMAMRGAFQHEHGTAGLRLLWDYEKGSINENGRWTSFRLQFQLHLLVPIIHLLDKLDTRQSIQSSRSEKVFASIQDEFWSHNLWEWFLDMFLANAVFVTSWSSFCYEVWKWKDFRRFDLARKFMNWGRSSTCGCLIQHEVPA